MATWPVSLPAPLLEGYQIAPLDQTVRTDMEVGAARVRRRTFSRNDLIDVSWVFTGSQMAAFRSWFDGDDGGGAEWFAIDLDLGGAVESVDARFKGAWKAGRIGLHWKVSGQLEVR